MKANLRLQNETAFDLARSLLGIVQNCIRPEEHRDAFESFYETCKAAIERYEIQRQRMLQRLLHPSDN
jgi:hypothetical protein